MKKRTIAIIALLLITVLSLSIVSCGMEAKTENGYDSDDKFVGEIDKAEGTTTNTAPTGDGSKIIKTASVTAETQEYAKATEDLKVLIEDMGGHISNSSASENASYRSDGKTEKRAIYTIKVPSDKFDEFLSSLSNLFNITELSTSTEDVSESYFTLQARISTLEAKREGLVSMLKNVDVNTDFTTWQKINAELTEIDTQLNVYNEQLKSLENRVAYSTVSLSVREVAEYTETEEKGYGEEVIDAFKGSFNAVVEFFKGFLLVMIYVLPFLLISGGCAIVVVVIVRSSVKKKKAKKDKNENNNG